MKTGERSSEYGSQGVRSQKGGVIAPPQRKNCVWWSKLFIQLYSCIGFFYLFTAVRLYSNGKAIKSDNSHQGASPTISSPLPIAEQFDEAKLKEAINIRLAKDITRKEFLTLIAAAGVATYKSDMLARTITFRGLHSDSYVLHIPQM